MIWHGKEFKGFNYKYDETQQTYIFTFKMTDEGKKKMTEATTELVETSGDLSLWFCTKLISTPRVMEPISGNEFAVTMANLSKDSISMFVNKLEGK